MTRAYLAFTETGLALAKRLSTALPGSVARCGQDGVSLAEWTSAQFVQSDALIFVGAAGIAVRRFPYPFYAKRPIKAPLWYHLPLS